LIQGLRKKLTQKIAAATSLLHPARKLFFFSKNSIFRGTGLFQACSFYFLGLSTVVTAASGCSLIATRPVQEMSDTSAALRAAREVQADSLAPELYRMSTEWFFRAKKEYKFKNFYLAKNFADKARRYAEQAEFEAVRNGGTRVTEQNIPDPLANSAAAMASSPSSSENANSGSQSTEGTPGVPMDLVDEKAKSENPEAGGQPTAAPSIPPTAPSQGTQPNSP
jgi:hypothetical protein